MNNGRLIWPALGFIVWSSAFIALYAMLSVGCRFGWDQVELPGGMSLQRAQLIVILLVHLAAGLLLVLWLRKTAVAREAGAGAFLARVAWLAAVAALASTAFSFFGVFGLSSCH